MKTLVVILLFIGHHSSAQKQAANWVFGYSCGLNFTDANPEAFSRTGLKANEGCAVESDRRTGNLLFYTDGRNFWNAQRELMPSSVFSTECATTISQPAIIIQAKQDQNFYHVFTLRHNPEDKIEHPSGCFLIGTSLNLVYNKIDMRLDFGKGDLVVSESNETIQTDLTEKLTAVQHTNGTDYWIIVHGWNSNRFYSYQLSANGLSSPVITDIGSIHGFHDYQTFIFQELGGLMKASPDGKKIACAVSLADRPFDLFDFDANTGLLSNYVNLGNVQGQHGVSFSPNSTKLYVSSDGPEPISGNRSILLQYDLAESTTEKIIQSRMSIISNNPKTNLPPSGVFPGFDLVEKDMALALDGRLYVAGNGGNGITVDPHVMVVIDQPDEKGFACNVNMKRFDFGNGIVNFGLPNFMQHYFSNIESSSVCQQPTSLNLFPNPADEVLKVTLSEGCGSAFNLTIINSIGQVVLRSNANGTETVDVSHLAGGIYVCIISTKFHDNIIKKLVKR